MVASSRGTSSSSSMSGGGVGTQQQQPQAQDLQEGGQFAASSAPISPSNGILTGSAGHEAMRSVVRPVTATNGSQVGMAPQQAGTFSPSAPSKPVPAPMPPPPQAPASQPPPSQPGMIMPTGGIALPTGQPFFVPPIDGSIPQPPPPSVPPPASSSLPPVAPGRRSSAPATFSADLNGDDDDEEMSGNRSTFTCKHCKKEFTLKGNLKRHILTHAGVKPYICGICNKGFSRKADLEIHNRVHTGEKPYECPAAGCGKKFARISDLRSHERTHSGVKAFKCTFKGCDRQFARRYDMKKHAKVHQKEPARTHQRVERDEYSSGDDSMDTSRYSSDSSSGHHRVPKKTGGRGSRPYARRGSGGGGSSSAWSNGPMEGSYTYNVPSDVDAAYRMQAMRGGGGPINPPHRAGMERGGLDLSMPSGAPLNDVRSTIKRSQASETRGYRVLHNGHVDHLSPNGVLECRESGVKAVHGEAPIGSSRLPKKLTEEDVLKASVNCRGEHGTEDCTCIQIEHDGHICCIVDGRLLHRNDDDEQEDHGEFRILDDDFLAFYEGIESLVQDQSSVSRNGSAAPPAPAVSAASSSSSSAGAPVEGLQG